MRQSVFGALACALALAACARVGDTGSTEQTTTTQPAASGTLRIGIQRSPNTLNPILPSNTTEGMIDRLFASLLVTVSADGKTQVADLAAEVPTTENGGISKDGKTITYKLRRNVKWHDGVAFTSKDVKFSYQAVMNDANNVNSRTGYDVVSSVDTPDDYTVVFHLKQLFAPFVNTVFGESDNPYMIIPEHLLAKYPNLNQVPFNQSPVGTGPFKVARWVRGDHVELVANDDYFLGKPKLRSIIVREIPSENTMVNALRAHDIDWQYQASPNLAQQLKAIPNLTVDLNDKPQTLGMLMNTSRAPLNDVRVREAIAYAVDKGALIDRTTGGTATVAWADQPPFSWSYEPNVTKYVHDVAKAKALLAQAGYTPGSDGIMRKNGQPISLQLSYNVENATRQLVATQMQAMLKEAGIDTQIKTYPANLLFATYGQGGILTTGKYDLNLSGWVAGIDPDDHSLYQCGEVPSAKHPTGVNYTRYCNPEMEAAQRTALSTNDRGVRKGAYSKIQQLLARDVPELYIWFPRQLQPVNPAFKGFTPNPVTESWNAWQWEI